MNKQILLGLIATTVCTFVVTTPTLLLAQVSSPVNICDLQQLSDGIVFSGRVTNIVGNKFLVDDGAGQVIVDVGSRRWREINLQLDEQIAVRGQLGEKGELNAFSITRADGSVINIRSTEGISPNSRCH